MPNASRSQWLSVNPAQMTGTGSAPGSNSATNDSTALQSGVSSEDRVPPSAFKNSRSYGMSVPSMPRTTGSISAGVCPGSRRQSTTISQSAGMTLRFREAEIIVGANVGASSGSINSATVASRSRARATTSPGLGTSPSSARRKTSTSSWICGSGRYAAIRSTRRAALTSALSAMPGIDAWPERPCTRTLKGAVSFSAVATIQ